MQQLPRRLPWFRLYNEVVDDPKVQRLSGAMFKHWINVLCLASKNGGIVPSLKDVAFKLRINESKAALMLDELLALTLLDAGQEGELRPHNWEGRQYRSDDVTARVQKSRAKRNVTGNADETLHVTPPDTDTDQKQIRAETEGESEPFLPVLTHPFDKFEEGMEIGPYATEYIAKYQESNHGNLPSRNAIGAAKRLERQYGSQPCVEMANDFGWDMHPNYLKEKLNDPKPRLHTVGRTTGRRAGAAAAGPDLDEWDRYVAGEDQRRPG